MKCLLIILNHALGLNLTNNFKIFLFIFFTSDFPVVSVKSGLWIANRREFPRICDKVTHIVKIYSFMRNFADEIKKILTDICICRINIKERRNICHKNIYFYAFLENMY